MWKREVDSEKFGSVWVDDNRFIILSPYPDNRRWIVRIGVKDSTNQNQEVTYKNRSRAMIKVNSLLKSKSWKYHA